MLDKKNNRYALAVFKTMAFIIAYTPHAIAQGHGGQMYPTGIELFFARAVAVLFCIVLLIVTVIISRRMKVPWYRLALFALAGTALAYIAAFVYVFVLPKTGMGYEEPLLIILFTCTVLTGVVRGSVSK